MKKLFVSYEIALALKELGFDEECIGMYYNRVLHYKDQYAVLSITHNFEYGDGYAETFIIKNTTYPYGAYTPSGNIECISAPIYQQVIDWLREKKDLLISTRRDGGWWIIDVVDLSDEDESSPFDRSDARAMEDDYYKALTDAIEQALKLIKN